KAIRRGTSVANPKDKSSGSAIHRLWGPASSRITTGQLRKQGPFSSTCWHEEPLDSQRANGARVRRLRAAHLLPFIIREDNRQKTVKQKTTAEFQMLSACSPIHSIFPPLPRAGPSPLPF